MRWRITKDSDGDNRLRLERRKGGGNRTTAYDMWETVDSKYWHPDVDLSRVVPRTQARLLRRHLRKHRKEEQNRAYQSRLEEQNRQWAEQNL